MTTSRSDLVSEAIAGACAAVAVVLVLEKSDVVHRAAARVPRLGWKPDATDEPPILARLAGTLIATIVFRSTFSVTRTLAQRVI